jgi:anthranilate phosphoribosyltransferase
MKKILSRLFSHQTLERTKQRGDANLAKAFITKQKLLHLLPSINAEHNHQRVAGFSGWTAATGAAVELNGHKVMDIVGTVVMERTPHISTLLVFNVAARGTSSQTWQLWGFINQWRFQCMERLATIQDSNDSLKREIERSQFTFLHAPLFHPALKRGCRPENLGFRTFSYAGANGNPAKPEYQL